MKSWLRAFAVSLVVATLLLGQTIGEFSAEVNRFFWKWDRTDPWVHITLLVGLALVGMAIYVLMRNGTPGVRKGIRHLFLIVVAAGLMVTVGTVREWSFGWQVWLWSVVALLVAASLRRPAWNLPTRVARVAVFMAAWPAILVGQMLWWAPWGVKPTPPSTVIAERAGATRVLLLSFDGWGWPQCQADGEFRADLPNLRKLSEESWLFRRAISAGPATRVGLPGLVYQTDAEFLSPGRRTNEKGPRNSVGLFAGGKFIPFEQATSIFGIARGLGYRTTFSTFYMPWRRLLAGQVDEIGEHLYDPKGSSFARRVASRAIRTFQYQVYPGSYGVSEEIERRRISEHWLDVNAAMREDTLRWIQTAGDNSFGLFHQPLPHHPFVFNADGSYRGPYRRGEMIGTLAEYQDQLIVLDRFVGQVVAELKRTGKYNNTLLILTSDHGYVDKANPRRMDIPIVVKGPGQTHSERVEERVQNTRLKPLMELAMRGEWSHERARMAVEQMIHDSDTPPRVALKIAPKMAVVSPQP